ncbi:MAG: triose-phosphate isomerase [Burkholderiaceae bacterium]|nr:MAG: triose-phosphate isomerase [Burkholderiaceae bacterium]
MVSRKKIIAGNWKMNGGLAANQALVTALKAAGDLPADVAVCVPYPYLAQAQQLLQGSAIALGAQNVSEQTAGAFTGEVSGEMLREFGCTYAIVGHSERRTLYGETDAQIARKCVRAQQAGLVPILCIGETLAEREANRTETVVAEQLDAVLSATGIAAFANIVIAYEPVWAIGTGKTATPQQAQDVHAFIRQRLAAQDANIAAQVRIQYGGSMKPGNAKELMAMPDIDGGLIGGASLVAEDFLAICKAA